MQAIRVLLIALFVLGMSLPGLTQSGEQVERIGASAILRENTEVVSSGKALVYAGQVMRGTVGSASGESVESAINRLFAIVGQPDEGRVTIEFSADNALWHSDQRPSDNYFRLVYGDVAISGVQFAHPSAFEFEFSADNQTWHSTQGPEDRFFRMNPSGGDPTGRVKFSAPSQVHMEFSSDNVNWHDGQQPTDNYFRISHGGKPAGRVKFVHPTDIALQFSEDNISWHAEQQPADNFFRLQVAGTQTGRVKIVHPTDIALQFSSDNQNWHGTQQPADNFFRLNIGGTATARVKFVHPSDIVVRASDVVGLDARVEQIIDIEGLAYSHGPLWTKPQRQALHVGTPFTLDLNEYVDEATHFSATNLPDGVVVSTQGIVSGTPTTEGAVFPVFSAVSSGGTSTVSVPFIVLRRASFDTGHFQLLTGLTFKDSSVVTLDKRGYLYFFNPKTGAVNPAEPTITFAPTTAPSAYSAVVNNGTDFTVLANLSSSSSPYPPFSLMRFVGNNDANSRTTGSQVGASVSNTHLAGAAGLAFKTAPANQVEYWVVGRVAATNPQLSGFASNFDLVTGQTFRLAPTSLSPQGVVYRHDDDNGSRVERVYVADAATNAVKVFSLTGTTGSGERYREFDLVPDNNQPKGITYVDNYFSVLNRAVQGAGGVNDKIFTYPDKAVWDEAVPDLTELAFVNQGSYNTDDYIRVRATFSAPVDITSDVTLRLDVGGTERQAISVANVSGTTAAAQTDTTTAYFAYQVVSGDTDTDGVETYQFPFREDVGTILPHENPLQAHKLNGSSTWARVTQPGGLGTLLPRPSHRTNSAGTPDFAETDANEDDYIRNVPNALRAFTDDDRVSLDQWHWTREDVTGITYNSGPANPTNMQLADITRGNQALWQTGRTVSANHYLYMRVQQNAVNQLAGHYVLGNPTTWYGDDLSKVQTDSANWKVFNTSASGGYFYYGYLQPTSVQSTAFTAARHLSFGVLDIDLDEVQADWREEDPSKLSYIHGKPISLTTVTGENTGIDDFPPRRNDYADVVDIDIPQNLRDYATRTSQMILVETRTRWRRKPGTPGPVYMKLDPLNQGGQQITGAVRERLPLTTTFTTYVLDFRVPATTTRVQFRIDRFDGGAGIAEVSHVAWELSFEGGEIADASISTAKLADGAVTTVKVADDAVTTAKIPDEAITEPKLDISDTPAGDEVLAWDGTDMTWEARLRLLDFESDSNIQVAISPGDLTLAQAEALTYGAQIGQVSTARTGRRLYVKILKSKNVNDYALHIGNPTDEVARNPDYLIPFNSLTVLGDDNSVPTNTYYHSAGLTVPANFEVYIMAWNTYARDAIQASYESEGAGTGVQQVTGIDPITVTGTTTKVVSVNNNAIGPAFLKADTDAEKQAMRERFEAAWNSGADVPFTIAETSQGAGGAGANLDWNIALTNDLHNFADGRPYEATVAVTLAGVSTTETIVVTVSLRNNHDLTKVYDTEDVTSASGGEQRVYLSTSLAAGSTGLVLRTVRKTGTIGYKRSAEGVIQVQPKPAGLTGKAITWTASQSPGATPVATFTHSQAYQIGNMVFYSFYITFPQAGSYFVQLPVTGVIGSWAGQGSGNQIISVNATSANIGVHANGAGTSYVSGFYRVN